MKLHLLLLILGLMLSPVKSEEGIGDNEGKEPPENEMIDDVSALVEAKEVAKDEKLEEIDDVVKKFKEAEKKQFNGGYIWNNNFEGRKIIFGSQKIQTSCDCNGDFEIDKWPPPGFHVNDELIITGIFDDDYRYTFKIKLDKNYIYWVQKKGGKWGEFKKVPLKNIDNYIGLSIIQWNEYGTYPIFGIVRGRSVIAFGQIKQMAYTINRMWGNYLLYAVHKKYDRNIKKYVCSWKGKKYYQYPTTPNMLCYPYFLPERQRRLVWIIVKHDRSGSILVLPKSYLDPEVSDIKWPDTSDEWGFPTFENELLPHGYGYDSCEEDQRNQFGECKSEGELEEPSESESGSGGGSSQNQGGANSSQMSEEYSKPINGQSCTCRKCESCRCHAAPYKTLKTGGYNATMTNENTTKKAVRKKRSNDVNGYQEFLKLTIDCKSERRCRRAYTKFLNNGVIRIKE